MRIGEVSALTGLSPAALRYYEREGLLPAPRRLGGKRCYAASDVAAIRAVKSARAMGFGIAELKMIGEVVADRGRRRQVLAKKLAAGEAALAALLRQQAFLSAALACACDRPEQCDLIPGMAAEMER